MGKKLFVVVLAAILTLLTGGVASAQHGGVGGHLPATTPQQEGRLKLLGQLEVTDQEGLVADVAAYGNYAYLANWGEADCAGPETGGVNTPDAGAWVIDISDPTAPREVNFIPMPQDTRPGEGMQVVHIETDKFSGEILVMNAEGCGKNYKGGFMLYDVTNPLKPVKLKEGFGERTKSDAHQTHSAFVWQPELGGPAYLVTQDEEDLADVDIYDITNPRRPRLITELDLNTFVRGGVAQPALNLADSNLHDATVKCIAADDESAPLDLRGKCIMIASYWDGGYVLLDVTNPAAPVYIRDTDYDPTDPELSDPANEAVPPGSRLLTPEGNAHQAELTADNRFFIGTDEDFSPYRARITTDDGAVYDAGEFGWTVPLNLNPEIEGPLNGPTVFGGYGCPADRNGTIPDASTLTLAPGEESILVLQRGPVGDPSQTQDACFFSEKVETAQLLGYDAVIIANHHGGALGGEGPNTYFCGGQGHIFDIQTSALCVGHAAMHELFDVTAGYTYPEAQPTIGSVGDNISVTTQFDGWGYVHLFDAANGADLDTYAIPEAMDPAFASGFGDLSVHEVATDPNDPSLLYLSYYSGGVRMLQIVCPSTDSTAGCVLEEVGAFIDDGGSNFWGVEVIPNPADDPDIEGDESLILASDRDYGLYLFTDP